MIKRLVEFLQNNFPDTNINDYLDSKFIELNSEQLKKIADAIKDGELSIKPASSCPADKFIFQFGTTIIFVNRDTSNNDQKYNAELAWETDFFAIHSARNKAKGFYFIGFSFDDDYNITLTSTDKVLEDQVRNEDQNKEVVEKAIPVLRGFMSAISS